MSCIGTARMGPADRAGTGRPLPFLPGECMSQSETNQHTDVLLSGLFLLTCFDEGRWLGAVHSQGMSVPSAKGCEVM